MYNKFINSFKRGKSILYFFLQNLRPDQWVQIIKLKLDDYACVRKGWILENFPQTRAQALALQTAGILPKHTSTNRLN
jgi:adenylate kinase family enzyme